MGNRDLPCQTLQCLPGLSHQGMAGMFPEKNNRVEGHPTTLRYSQGQLEAEDQAVKSDLSCCRPAVSHGSIKSDPEQATESSCGHIQWVRAVPSPTPSTLERNKLKFIWEIAPHFSQATIFQTSAGFFLSNSGKAINIYWQH